MSHPTIVRLYTRFSSSWGLSMACPWILKEKHAAPRVLRRDWILPSFTTKSVETLTLVLLLCSLVMVHMSISSGLPW